MELVRGRTITGETITVDEKQFIDCWMVDCILHYSGGSVVFERTYLQGCQYVFFGAARGTVHFLQGVGLLSHEPGSWSEVPDHVH